MEKLYSKLDEIIECIIDSKEYKNCLMLKDKMDNNHEIKELVSNIKKLQKKYIRSCYDSNIKSELNILEEKLNSFPIYYEYICNLNVVNEKIDYVKDSLNDYFFELLNKKY